MKVIDLNHFACFRTSTTLEQLDRLVKIHQNLMPHQVAAATGCTLDQAMALLIVLWASSAAKPTLLVYHIAHQDEPPIQSRSITGGPPPLPLVCDQCGENIEDPDELAYDFLFSLSDDITFTVGQNGIL